MTTFRETNTLVKIILVIIMLSINLHECQIEKLEDKVKALEYELHHKYTDSVNNSHYHYDSIKRAMHTNH